MIITKNLLSNIQDFNLKFAYKDVFSYNLAVLYHIIKPMAGKISKI